MAGDIVWYLTDGFWEDRGEARHAFNVQPGGTLTVNITGLTPAGQQLARWALDAWTNVSGIRFQEVTRDSAHIVFYDHHEGAWTNYTYYLADGSTAQAFVNISTDWLDRYGTGIDTFSFSTYVHEIGHALGLGHPGDYNGAAFFHVDAKYPAADDWIFTVMSYFDQHDNPLVRPIADVAYPASPMMVDVVAIHALYGPPEGINEGDTVYGYQSNTGTYMDEIFRVWDQEAQSFFQDRTTIALTIIDTGGQDWLDFRTDTRNQYINLGHTDDILTISDVYGTKGNLILAYSPENDIAIEHVTAGSGNDIIAGNALYNIIFSMAGNDVVFGQGDDDLIVGGSGDDFLSGDSGQDLIIGGTGHDTLQGGSGADIFFFAPADGMYWDRILDFNRGDDKINLAEFETISSRRDFVLYRYNDGEHIHGIIDLTTHGGGWIVMHDYARDSYLSDSDFIFHDDPLIA